MVCQMHEWFLKLIHLLVDDESYIEFTVAEDSIVKIVILIVLIPILIWIYEYISYHHIMGLKKSIDACVLPSQQTKTTFYQKFGNFLSRSMVSRIMTVLNSEIARGKTNLEERKTPGVQAEGGALKGILVKDRSSPMKKRSASRQRHDGDGGVPKYRYGLDNCSLTFQPAYIIPVSRSRKLRFNKKITENMRS